MQSAPPVPARRWPLAAAAAVLLLAIALLALRLEVQVGHGTLMVAFNAAHPVADTIRGPEPLSRAEINQLVAQQIAFPTVLGLWSVIFGSFAG